MPKTNLYITEFTNLPKLAKVLAPIIGKTLPETKAILGGASFPIFVGSFDEETATRHEGALFPALCRQEEIKSLEEISEVSPPPPQDTDLTVIEPEVMPDDVVPELTPAQVMAAELFGATVGGALELCANCGDEALLVDVVEALKAEWAAQSLIDIVEDRIRVLRRPSVNEALVEELISTSSKNIEAELTEEERASAAASVVEYTVTIAQLTAEAKAAAELIKARIKVAEAERATQVDRHVRGKEWRVVETRVVYVPGLDKVRVVRSDTGAVLEEREPRDDERQRALFN